MLTVGILNMRSFSLGLASFISLILAPVGYAAPVKSLDFTIHEEYTSTRALGMGNAFTAVADDHSAIFYNPATLANRTDGHLRMFMRGGTDEGALKLKSQLSDIKNVKKEDQTKAYTDLIVSNYGQHYYLRAPTIGAVWVRPGWGLAFIPADLSFDADVHRQIGPMINVNVYVDSTLAFSYAKKVEWFGSRHALSWGATVKAVHRVYAGSAISAGALADGSSVFSTSDGNEGLTGDLDLGSYWTPPVPATGFFSMFRYFKPSFAMVGRNLVDYGFTTNLHFINKDSGEPPKLGRRFDLGSKWEFPKVWIFDPHFAADIRNIGSDNWTPKKGAHAGVELYWKMYNWWKGHWAAGLNQGYWTAGVGARLAWFQMDIASWGEEVGTDTSPKEDRRYILELALDF